MLVVEGKQCPCFCLSAPMGAFAVLTFYGGVCVSRQSGSWVSSQAINCWLAREIR